MARIRTIKPEFWRSPSTASASPWARLLFIAMWNWADDHGRAEWTPRELLGFAFPHDTESPCTDAEFPLLLAEVADAFAVKFYINSGRRFYEIPSWDSHQKSERRTNTRFVTAEDPESFSDQGIYDLIGNTYTSGGNSAPASGETSVGTGEQGNIGTGEHRNRGTDSSSGTADAVPRPEVKYLLDLLDDELRANGAKPTGSTKRNQDEMRRLLDIDGRTVEQVEACIRWCQSDPFWKANILSASKLREKYDQLRLKAQSQQQPRGARVDQNLAEYARLYGRSDDDRAGSVPALDAGVST